MSLIARHLESLGTPTVCIGTARDILAAGNPPRAVFLDYPLGNTLGRPFAPDEQYSVTRSAIEALERTAAPGTIETLGHVWSDDESWKAEAGRTDGIDRRQPRDLTPRYQFEEDRIAAEVWRAS